ncbi:collagen alpha-1(VII) chain [Thalassophryne amazonica]|uniref:collagen alpha-1(VII) chain n=1 Tax=Thalassophryne amazonica TaxID=390379 RepID=UPI00147141E3|nr:collagen alpha-1(VII) chain [Thalassophryne amazonica]
MGLPGTPGVPGLNGLTGRKGNKGEGGTNGGDGDPGDKGEKGAAGFSGFPGFKGSSGSPGRDGEEGPPGVPGPSGDTGPKGERGRRGRSQCQRGAPGSPGLRGQSGAVGIAGSKGEKGEPGLSAEDVKELVTQQVAEKCGLEFNFIIKSIDPDSEATVTEKENEPEDVVMSLTRDQHEEETPSNHTGQTAEWEQRKKRAVILKNTVAAVSAADRCLEPMSEGSCSEYLLLWYFHSHSGECRPFLYGGCGGTENRFPSRQECRRWCVDEKGTEPRR